jgi:hypothetical protein
LSLAKSAKVGKSKNRKRATEHFKNLSQLLRLLINVNKNTTLQRKGMEITTFLPIAAGKFSLLSYWLVADIWAFPSGFSIPFENCPEAAQYPLGISQRLFYTLLAVLSGCPTAFKSISQQLSAKTWQFPSLFLEGPRFC